LLAVYVGRDNIRIEYGRIDANDAHASSHWIGTPQFQPFLL
jgi:hypothetical protein